MSTKKKFEFATAVYLFVSWMCFNSFRSLSSNSQVVSAVLSSQVGNRQRAATETFELNPISLTFNFISV